MELKTLQKQRIKQFVPTFKRYLEATDRVLITLPQSHERGNSSYYPTPGLGKVHIPVKSSTESGHAVQWRREATLVREL